MPLEFDKKKEVMRTEVKLECQQAGKESFAIPLFWNSSLIALGLCVSFLIWEKEKKKPPDFWSSLLVPFVS